MSWFSNKFSGNIQAPTALQAQRSRQIESLKIFNQDVSEIQRDVEYVIRCNTQGTTYNLTVKLPPQFPQEKPSVYVSPPAQHPWINDQMCVIGCSGINNFMMHSDLGRVIQQIVDEFKRNPPVVLLSNIWNGSQSLYRPPSSFSSSPPGPSSYAPMPSVPVRSSYSNSNQTQPHLESNFTSSRNRAASPSEYNGTEFPGLKDLGENDLQELSNNEEKLLDYLRRLPEIQHLEMEIKEKRKSNEQRATYNIGKKERIEDLKSQLLEKHDILNEKITYLNEACQKHEILRQNFNPHDLQTKLKIALAEAEEQSEIISEEFLEGKIDIDEFKKKFMDSKTISYKRRAKDEKLHHYIDSNPFH